MALFPKRRSAEADRRRAIYREHPEELERMLVDCNVFDSFAFDDPDFSAKVARRNYALSVLYDIGSLNDGALRQIVDCFLKVNYITEEESHGE